MSRTLKSPIQALQPRRIGQIDHRHFRSHWSRKKCNLLFLHPRFKASSPMVNGEADTGPGHTTRPALPGSVDGDRNRYGLALRHPKFSFRIPSRTRNALAHRRLEETPSDFGGPLVEVNMVESRPQCLLSAAIELPFPPPPPPTMTGVVEYADFLIGQQRILAGFSQGRG